MDLSQLRYPVVCWTGRTPLHQIRAVAIAFPQPPLYADKPIEPLRTTRVDPVHTTKRSHDEESKQPHPINPHAPAATANELPLICVAQHPPHAFLMTGSLTGELAHWFIPSYRTEGLEKRKLCGSNHAVPRAMLLRQGAAACTALTYCRDGLTQMFCAGTSEGFLTLWSVGGGRCIRSELVLPFAPSQILFYQRYNPLAHGKSRNASPSPTPASHAASPSPPPGSQSTSASASSSSTSSSSRRSRAAAATMHNYLLCSSEESTDVYVVELPSLTVLATLVHRAAVAHMALVPPASSKGRTPFLVTVTQQHHISLWDLNQIEKKYEEKKRVKLAQINAAGGGRPRSLSQSIAFSIALSPPTNESLQAQLSNPTSSLASNAASIIPPSGMSGSASSGSSGGASGSGNSPPSTAATSLPPGSIVVRWTDPTQSFLLPLPPFSFTLSPLFVPVSLALSPDGQRGVIVFPYAFLMLDLRSMDVEGGIRAMKTDLIWVDLPVGGQQQSHPQSNHATSSSPSMWQPPSSQTVDAEGCITKHAPWAGAGFISGPASTTATTSGAEASSQAQHLVLWNASGELVWIYALTQTATVDADAMSSGLLTPPRPSNGASSTQRKPPVSASTDAEIFGGPLGIGGGMKRSLSSTKLPGPTGGRTMSASSGLISSSPPAREAPELSGSASPPRVGPKVQLVARCIIHAKAPPIVHHPEDEHKEAGFTIRRPGDQAALLASSPAVAQAQAHPISIAISGHTIFAGTEHGEMIQWHIPICSNPGLFKDVISNGNESAPMVFLPTHISSVSDAFGPKDPPHHGLASADGAHQLQTSPNTLANGSTPRTPESTVLTPRFNRAMTTPGLVSPRNASASGAPSRTVSPGIASHISHQDPPTTSTMLIDAWHEAVLLAVGHQSGMIKVYNVLSKATTHLDLSIAHNGPVTCMLSLAGWIDACMLATGGADGRIFILEMSTGTMQLALSCHAPVIGLHKPTALAEESLPHFYRGANSALLFANCADSSLRAFNLNENGVSVFVARGLDSPVKGVFRPSWAITGDMVLVQSRQGTVYVYSLTSSHMLQQISLEEGSALFLQKHDLIAPGSQLAILAHRLYQVKHLRKKALPPLPGTTSTNNTVVTGAIALGTSSTTSSPSLSRSESSSALSSMREGGGKKDSGGSFGEGLELQSASAVGGGGGKLGAEDGGLLMPPSVAGASIVREPSPAISYDSSPPPLQRARSTVGRSPSKSDAVSSTRPHGWALLRQKSSGRSLVDPSFHREIYRLNLAHQALEREEEEHKREADRLHAAQQHHHAGGSHLAIPSAFTQHQLHYSALNPPVPAAHGRALPHSASVSSIINPVAAAAQNAAHPVAVNQASPATGAMKPSASSNTLAQPQLSPPPPGSFAVRSPIGCVDVVSSTGSSSSPLAHLHVNVYVWNVHQILPFLSSHALALVAMQKRQATIQAAKADPTNQVLAAAANQAKATAAPPAFYVLCGLLSTLFDWDSHSPIEPLLRTDLRCYPPSPPTSFATLSDNSQGLTILLPGQSARDHARWTMDPDLTSRHMLALTTTVQHMLEKSMEAASPAVAWMQTVLTHYHSTIPRAIRSYIEADIHVLSLFALNVHRTVHSSARQLIQHVLERMSPTQRLALAEQHGRFFEYALPAQRMIFQPEFSLSPADLVSSGSILAVCENGPGIGFVSDEEMQHAMLLSWIGLFELRQQRRSGSGGSTAADLALLASQNESLSEFQAKSQFLTNTLLRMIAWPASTEHEVVKCALACELLAKGLIVFRHHITEPLLLLRRLYTLSQHVHEGLSKSATNALLDSGKIAPTHFITCIQKEAMNYRSSKASKQGALMCIVGLIKRHPLALARTLPSCVRMIVSTLDAESTLRSTLLQASTSALYALTATYPQVSFHQTTQRYAVGTSNGAQSVIIVYDLRTATKWRILEGHTGDIHAVSFHPKGLSLASYSATENPPSVRVWSTGGGGFLSGLLGMEGKCTHSWPMLPCIRKIAPAPPALNNLTTSVTPSSSHLDSSHHSSDGDDDSSVGDVDEPVDEEDPDASPKSLAPRVTPQMTHDNRMPLLTRFSVEELLGVKIMWISDKSLKLKRENGELVDFSMG